MSLPADLVSKWESMCITWDADSFPKTVDNPYNAEDAGNYIFSDHVNATY